MAKSEVLRTFFDNATSIKDYRSQMRGKKAFWIWFAYLVILVAIAFLTYGEVNRDATNPSELQNGLYEFYSVLCRLLGGAVCLVAPALTAASLATERQRKSLDLLFSAPVEPKYLLIGKILASYRYIWMMLILALPVLAVSIVFGGATWVDVVGSYAILSANGLILASMGVAVAAREGNPVRAIFLTFSVVAFYLLVTGMFGSFTRVGMYTGNLEAPWIAASCAFLAPDVAPTYTLLRGTEVPNWILFCLFSIPLSGVLVFGGASAISDYRSRDTLTLRILSLIIAFCIGPMLSPVLGTGGVSAPNPYSLGFFTVSIVIIWSLAVPATFGFSRTEPRKYKFDGFFNFKRFFWGTPSSSLPFVLTLNAALHIGFFAAGGSSDLLPGLLSSFIWTSCYAFAWWGVGIAVSSNSANLELSRRRLLLRLVFLIIGTLLALASLPALFSNSGLAAAIYFPFYPLLGTDGMKNAPAHGVIYVLIGYAFFRVGHQNLQLPPVVR